MTAIRQVLQLKSTVTALSETRAHLQEERESARNRLEELDTRCQDVDRTIASLQQELQRSAPGPTVLDRGAAEYDPDDELQRSAPGPTVLDRGAAEYDPDDELQRSAPGPTVLGTPNAVDLSDCTSHTERLVRIAVANGGLLNIPAARDIILSAGASKADPHHLGSNILKLVKRHAQDWEDVGNRIYRYRRFANKDDEDP